MLFSIQFKFKASLFIAAIFLICWHRSSFANEQFSMSVKPGYEFVDVKHADFGGAFGGEVIGNFKLDQRLTLQTGLSGFYDSTTDNRCDNTGCYRISINSLEGVIGVRFAPLLEKKFSPYLRAGLLVYSMDVELEERFYNLKPSGTSSANESGLGWYWGVGASLKLSPVFSLLAEFQYKSRKDVFDDSSSPFDVNSIGLGVGCQWRF